MALSNTRTRAAAALVLVLVLFLAAVPSRAATRGTPGTTLPSFKAEVVRIFRFVLGAVREKTGTTPDSKSGAGSPPPAAPGGATPDIGSSLDPLG